MFAHVEDGGVHERPHLQNAKRIPPVAAIAEGKRQRSASGPRSQRLGLSFRGCCDRGPVAVRRIDKGAAHR
jgi:hypothetical protein